VQFILTGKAPPISQASVRHKLNSYGLNKIVLEVSPHLSGDRVKALYLREKKKSFRLIGKGGQSRTRRINDKYLALAVFAAKEYSLKVKNVQLLRLWNRKHRRQGWDYEEPRLLTSLGIAGPPLNASPDGNGRLLQTIRVRRLTLFDTLDNGRHCHQREWVKPRQALKALIYGAFWYVTASEGMSPPFFGTS